MCASCGCGQVNDQHGDSRNITLQDLDKAAQAAGTTREGVLQNMEQATGMTTQSQAPSGFGQSASGYQPSQGGMPSQGSYSPPQGQAPGTGWQESQQMGDMGRGNAQDPFSNP